MKTPEAALWRHGDICLEAEEGEVCVKLPESVCNK
jgi:hypothetical protein